MVAFVFLTAFLFGVSALVNPHGPTVVSDFTNCLKTLININFKKSGLLIFAHTKEPGSSVIRIKEEILKNINSKLTYSIEVSIPNKGTAVCGEDDPVSGVDVLHFDQFEPIPIADYFVLIFDTYKDFTYLASKIIRSRNWNPKAKFIVLFFNFNRENYINIKYIEKIMGCLFRYNVINVVVVTPQIKNIRNAIVYGWRPYDPPKYCGYLNESVNGRLIVENICEHGVVKLRTSVFKNRIPKNMKGCTLTMLALERQPFVSRDNRDFNLERKLVDELVKTFDFTIYYKIVSLHRGEREFLGEWSGALHELSLMNGEILLGGIFPDYDVHEDFECSSPYLADEYTWVVPRAHKLPPWVALTITFQHSVWYSAIAGFVICIFCWIIIGKLSDDSNYNKSIDHCILNSWIILLGFSAYIRPVTKSLRVFFAFLSIYSIVFVTAYQTKLFDVLTNPSNEYQIKTIEELVKSGLKFGGSEELHDLFFNSTDPFDNLIRAKWVDVEDIHQAMMDVAVHRNFSLLCSRLELAHVSAVMPELSDSIGNYKYYAFKINVFSVPIEMVSLKGFPFMDKFTTTMNVFKQSGIIAGIRRYFSAFNTRRKAKLLRSSNKSPSHVEPLSIKHLQGGFFALVLGYICGTVALIIEILIHTHHGQRVLIV